MTTQHEDISKKHQDLLKRTRNKEDMLSAWLLSFARDINHRVRAIIRFIATLCHIWSQRPSRRCMADAIIPRSAGKTLRGHVQPISSSRTGGAASNDSWMTRGAAGPFGLFFHAVKGDFMPVSLSLGLMCCDSTAGTVKRSDQGEIGRAQSGEEDHGHRERRREQS